MQKTFHAYFPKVGDDSDVILTLYDGIENVFVSEHYVIGWDKNGTPKDLDKLQNLTCLFTDLGEQDMRRVKLYLVCQVSKNYPPGLSSSISTYEGLKKTRVYLYAKNTCP